MRYFLISLIVTLAMHALHAVCAVIVVQAMCVSFTFQNRRINLVGFLGKKSLAPLRIAKVV